ncbi:MAG: hypothetical protein WCS37_15410 [Chloroflexota bacterium]|nr:hypothetical protein [Chloroflexota bacterium]
MARFNSYRRGFLWGTLLGALWLVWVYWRAQQFPGDPNLNRYYAHLRSLDK